MKKHFFLFTLILTFSLSSFAGVFTPIRQLAQRRVPWLAPHLQFEKIPPQRNAKDLFQLYTRKGKVIIAATNVNAAATGLNWYLEKYCHRSMSHLGDHLTPVNPLPKIKEKITINAPFQYRYALNYCTLNYTMSFYDWKDWQWELDWMALHGVNLMLMPIGTAAVWQNTLKKFGFSDKEIFDFLPGPAFNAWWLMGNMEGWGGPVTQRMIDRRTALAQHILQRMSALGIAPVLQGFYGMVPRVLKHHYPHAAIRSQGQWAGGFYQPSFLLPADSLFSQMATVYYQNVKQLYGSEIQFFGGDPFHEGGSSAGIDLSQAGEKIQSLMEQSFPGSTWILQGWQNNPKKGLLEGLDKNHVLVLELAGEKADDWERRKGFEHTPFIWCTANNFGGEAGLYGKLQFFADETEHIRKGAYKDLCRGIGIMPEGIHNNPVVYDFMLALGWHHEKIEAKSWIQKYALYRYGIVNDSIRKAWGIFLQTIYSSPKKDAGMPEDLFCARPAWHLTSVSTWGSIERDYDQKKFAAGVKTFLSAFPSMKDTNTYLIDAVDLSRQVIANKGNKLYHKIQSSFIHKDTALFKRRVRRFLHLMRVDDSLLSMSKHFRLRRWLKAARSLGTDGYERSLFSRNAREQITYWGPNSNPHTTLHDYAAKEWSGLIRNLYIPRWKLFFKQQLRVLRTGKEVAPIHYFEIERAWTLRKTLPGKVTVKAPENFIHRLVQKF